MPQVSRLKPVMVRVESLFTVFGRIGVMPGEADMGKQSSDRKEVQVRYVNPNQVLICDSNALHYLL